ncbi:MAG: DnaB-like helicase C-terminal domain-containing protein, partial [Pseudomonadota bacterium]
GMSTGLSKLDDMLGGLHRGDLYVIGGASSMGKTALAVNIAFGAARSEGRRVVLFSQEMTRQQLAWRVMSNQARRSGCGKVAYQALRNGSIGQNEYAILKAGAEHLPKSVKWNTARGLSVDDVKAGVRAASKSLGGIDVIVIDYLQILEIEQRKGSNRAADIQHATMQMKKLAGDMDACIVLLSQLKRLDHREDKRPLLSDLRESGGIEQDADTVLLAHREDYYLERSEPPWEPKDKHTEWWVKMQNAQGKLDVYVPKQRMGPIGLVQLHFEKETDLIVDEAAQIDDEDGFL